MNIQKIGNVVYPHTQKRQFFKTGLLNGLKPHVSVLALTAGFASVGYGMDNNADQQGSGIENIRTKSGSEMSYMARQAKTYLDQGDYGMAAACYKHAIDEDSDLPADFFADAGYVFACKAGESHTKYWKDMALDDYNMAIHCYNRFFEKERNPSIYIYANVAKVYFALDDYKNAAIYYKKSLENSAIFPGWFYADAGIAFMNIEEWHQSLHYYLQALDMNPDLGAFNYINVGKLFTNLKNYERAGYYYAQAMDRGVEFNACECAEIGKIFLEMKDWDKAALCFKKWEESIRWREEGVSAQTWERAGFAFQKQKEWSKASECYRKAIKNGLGLSLEFCLNAGDAFIKADYWNDAALCLTKAIEMNPDLAAQIYADTGKAILKNCSAEQYEKAALYLIKAISMDPNLTADVFVDAGETFLRLKKWDLAAKYYAIAVDKDPNLADHHYHATGFAHMKCEEWQKAAVYYTKELSYGVRYVWDGPVDELAEIIKLCAPYISDDTCLNGRSDSFLLSALGRYLQQERDEVMKMISPFVFAGWNVEKILNNLHEVPENEREGLVKIATPLLRHRQKMDAGHDGYILKVLCKIPEKEREKFVTTVMPIFLNLETSHIFNTEDSILEIFRSVPVGELEEFVRMAKPILSNFKEEHDNAVILRGIKEIPANIIELAMPILGNCNKYTVVHILDLLNKKLSAGMKFDDILLLVELTESLRKMKELEDKDVLMLLENLFLLTMTDLERTVPQLLKLTEQIGQMEAHHILISVFSSERADFIEYSLSLLNNDLINEKKEHKEFILRGLSKVPLTDFKKCLPDFLYIVRNVNEENFYYIENVMGDILKNDRHHFIRNIVSMQKSFFNDAKKDTIDAIIQSLPDIPVKEQEGFAILGYSLIKDFLMNDAKMILKYLKRIPSEERESVIKSARPLVTLNANDSSNIICILKILGDLPESKRVAFVSEFLSLMEGADKYHDEILGAFKHIAPKLYFQCIDILKSLKEKNHDNFSKIITRFFSDKKILSYLLNENEEIKRETYHYWEKSLESPDVTVVELISDFIINNSDDLGFFAEHDLYQLAIRSRILVRGTDSQSPYKFYENLIIKSKEPINFDMLKLPQEIISGYTVSLNPVYLLKFPSQGVKFQDLPEYNKFFLGEMIARLEIKSINHRIRFQFEVEQATGLEYVALKQGSLGSNYLLNLLSVQGNQNDIAPMIASKFIACVAYLASLSNEIRDKEFFSPREDAFLKMLSIIRACPVGKEGGVIDYYVSLPQEVKLKTVTAEKYESEEEHRAAKAKAFLNDIIAQEVEKILSNTENRFYKVLIGGTPDIRTAQGVHQELYVKNLIGPDVALLHSLTFDMHTQHLYENMVNKSKQEVLQIFYNHFVPHVIVDSVIKEVNAALQKEKNAEFMFLSEFMDSDMREKSWDIELKSGKISITEFGAIHLLQRLGVFK